MDDAPHRTWSDASKGSIFPSLAFLPWSILKLAVRPGMAEEKRDVNRSILSICEACLALPGAKNCVKGCANACSQVLRDKAVLKPTTGTRSCNCKQKLVTRQLGPGMFQQFSKQVSKDHVKKMKNFN